MIGFNTLLGQRADRFGLGIPLTYWYEDRNLGFFIFDGRITGIMPDRGIVANVPLVLLECSLCSLADPWAAS